MTDKIKTMTCRLPLTTWKSVMMLIINGKLKSVNAAIIEGLDLVLKKYKVKT